MIYAVKGFSVVEADVFLEFSCFFNDPMDAGNLISGSSAASKSSLYTWKYLVTYYWSLSWRVLSITLLTCEMNSTVWQFEHSLALSFFGTGMKTDLFQSCGHCWVFQICWCTEYSTLTPFYFRIWNSSTGIPVPWWISFSKVMERRARRIVIIVVFFFLVL